MRVSNVDVILRRCGIQIEEDGGCGLEKFNNFSLFFFFFFFFFFFLARRFATLWRAFSREANLFTYNLTINVSYLDFSDIGVCSYCENSHTVEEN